MGWGHDLDGWGVNGWGRPEDDPPVEPEPEIIYERAISGGGYPSTTSHGFSATVKTVTSQAIFKAAEDTDEIMLGFVWPNGRNYIGTISAAVDDGTGWKRVYFGEQVSHQFPPAPNTVTSPNQQKLSDYLKVKLVKGQQYKIRTCLTIPSTESTAPGTFENKFSGNGDAIYFDVDATDGRVMSKSDMTSFYIYGPTTIIGKVKKDIQSTIIIGDSIARGTYEGNSSLAETYNARGYLEKYSLRNGFGFMNLAIPGEKTLTAFTAIPPHTKFRLELIQLWGMYFPQAIVEYGRNDLSELPSGDEVTAETLKTRITGLINKIKSLGINKIILTTVTAKTKSTDSFMTVENQTVHANEAQKNLYNEWVKTGSAGLVYGYLDPASRVNVLNPTGDLVWVPNYIRGSVIDGTHPSQAGGDEMSLAQVLIH